MANVIKLKRGSGSDPSASDLVVGEVAIRTDSGKLFTKKDNGSIAEISGSGGGSDIFINTLSSSSGSGGGSATFNGTATRFTLSNPPAVSAQQLLVSINGVVQKPNSGTSPSEGFAIDGNDIIFAAAPATGSDFFIVTYGSLNIAVPADNSVTSAKIVDGTIVGTDLATNIDLVDNQKIRFGTGNDLQIYHDPQYGHSFIKESGSGALILGASTFEIYNAAISEKLFTANQNGAVELYYDNSKKFETTSGGATLTGNFLPEANNTRNLGSDTLGWNSIWASTRFRGNDNVKLILGDAQDLQIYHAGGTTNKIESGSNTLYVAADDLQITNGAITEACLKTFANGAVELYYDNAKKAETTANGLFVTGSLWADGLYLDDNEKIHLGTSGTDLQIYHNGGSGNYIDSVNKDLYLRCNLDANITGGDIILQPKSGENSAIFRDNGAVELYYDNALKLQTNSLGVGVGTSDTIIYNHSGTGTDTGVVIGTDGGLQIARNSDMPALLNRKGTDGNLLGAYNDGTFVGAIAVSGATTVYATSSDYRLKENVTAISDGITRLKTLKPYRFNFISNATKTVDGFFAHEVTAVPEAIVGEKDAEEMQGLDYAKLTPLLTAALQEAIAKIETLETKVAALEAK